MTNSLSGPLTGPQAVGDDACVARIRGLKQGVLCGGRNSNVTVPGPRGPPEPHKGAESFLQLPPSVTVQLSHLGLWREVTVCRNMGEGLCLQMATPTPYNTGGPNPGPWGKAGICLPRTQDKASHLDPQPTVPPKVCHGPREPPPHE